MNPRNFVGCAGNRGSTRAATPSHSRQLLLREEVRRAVHLAEAEIGAGEDRLGPLERVSLARTRCLAHVEVLHEEIAGPVELVDVLLGGVELVGLLLLDVLRAHQVRLEPRLLRFLLGDGLGIGGALGNAVRHEFLVILLRLGLIAFASTVSGGGGGASFTRICVKTVTPVPAMPPGGPAASASAMRGSAPPEFT